MKVIMAMITFMVKKRINKDKLFDIVCKYFITLILKLNDCEKVHVEVGSDEENQGFPCATCSICLYECFNSCSGPTFAEGSRDP